MKRKKTPEEKLAFKLFRKHFAGQGFAWSVGSRFPDAVQAAILEGIERTKKDVIHQFSGIAAP